MIDYTGALEFIITFILINPVLFRWIRKRSYNSSVIIFTVCFTSYYRKLNLKRDRYIQQKAFQIYVYYDNRKI